MSARAAKPKRKKPAKPEPVPAFINRLAFLQTWVEGAVVLEGMYDALAGVAQVFSGEPNHPATYWIDRARLGSVLGQLERLIDDMRYGPLLTAVSFPDPLSGGEPG